MQLYHDETQHTSSESSVVIENNKVYQFTKLYRDIQSKEQLNVIVEKLTLDEGYVLDSARDGFIVLTNPLDPTSEYEFDVYSGGMTRYIKKLVGKLDM